MAKKSKQTRAKEFSTNEREKIKERDNMCCIFCKMGYEMGKIKPYDQHNLSIMHYISKAQGGLGIEQNGAIGCQYHHHMLDNGPEGNRSEMKERFKAYLKDYYTEWNEKELTYNKWR